jgi:Domain of unknown function (DUF1905)/Bacteriocin-protection, YdeI or OmpD-Associated
MKFKAIIQLHGKTATGVEVPAKIVEGLGKGKRPPVHVTINGHTYRSSVASMGGKFMLGISAENREAAGVKAGDEVQVTLEADTEIREVTVPSDLKKALADDATASKFFDSLSYSNKLRQVLSIEQAKTDDTRQRRILKVVSMLREGKI